MYSALGKVTFVFIVWILTGITVVTFAHIIKSLWAEFKQWNRRGR